MSDLIFSLNATMPIFLLMVLGYVFRQLGFISDSFAKSMNTFVFKIALPFNLFYQLYSVDFVAAWNTKFVLYCFGTTAGSIFIAWALGRLIRKKGVRGEFIQASYRSSASLLGMAYLESIYGSSTMGPLMMLGAVPLYNVAAVIVLNLTAPKDDSAPKASLGEQVKNALLGIAKNPIILSILIGFVWSLLHLPMPEILSDTIGYVGGCASPLGLLSLGAMIDPKEIKGEIKPLLGASFLKLVGYVALFVPLAVMLGFRNDGLVAILIMLGSASTVAGFTMARNMGHDGNLSSGVVMLTTLLSSLTLTFWLYLFRSMGYI